MAEREKVGRERRNEETKEVKIIFWHRFLKFATLLQLRKL